MTRKPRGRVIEVTMYVVARGISGRPVCQHKLAPGVGTVTACGRDMERWSVTYTREALEAILCRRSQCRAQGGNMQVWVNLDWPGLNEEFISPLRLASYTDGEPDFYPIVEVPTELVASYNEAIQDLHRVVTLIRQVVDSPEAQTEINQQHMEYLRAEQERRNKS